MKAVRTHSTHKTALRVDDTKYIVVCQPWLGSSVNRTRKLKTAIYPEILSNFFCNVRNTAR